MKTEHQVKIMQIKEECNILHEKISMNIDDLCNDPAFGFREASHLSHIADRFDLFIKELNDF